MPKNYHCEYCDYRTGRKSSYTSHLNSDKHAKNISLYKSFRKSSVVEDIVGTNNIHHETEYVLKGTEDVPYSCSYCEKTLSCNKSLKRHYMTCKAKLMHDQKKLLETKLYEKDEQLLEKDKKLDELKEIKQELQELKEIKHDYYDLLKEIAKSKTSPKTINIHYVINHFTDALNYEDLMKPALTDAEIEKIEEGGPLCGIVFMIENRCINNIDVKKRPLHCLDTSRNKYLVRTKNEWIVDHNAKRIFKEAGKHMHNFYDINPATSKLPIEQIMKNQQKLLQLESRTSQNKLINDLNDKVYIKNIKLAV